MSSLRLDRDPPKSFTLFRPLVIGMMRQKYTMLQSTIPRTLLQSDTSELTSLDKIVSVACALTNLSKPIVPFD